VQAELTAAAANYENLSERDVVDRSAASLADGKTLGWMQGRNLPRVALVGLGVGALACARGPDEDWSVYEIDTELVRLSVRSGLFRTMPTCAPDMRIMLGEAAPRAPSPPHNLGPLGVGRSER
jgi:hypothetical protein